MRPATVFIVDDDASMRKALTRLLRSAQFRAVAFPSAREFLQTLIPDEPCCLLLDVRMPGMSGPDLQQQLSQLSPDLPIIFITGHGDIRMAVRTMQAGAVEFLTKPVKDKELLAAIEAALGRSENARRVRKSVEGIRNRIASLTNREREVMEGVVAGMLNKQIGLKLGTAEKTVKVHRARVMEKMGVSSVADLVRMVAQVGAHPADTSDRQQVPSARSAMPVLESCSGTAPAQAQDKGRVRRCGQAGPSSKV